MRCVHLAPLREQRSLQRAGVRGALVQLLDGENQPQQFAQGVFCMPVLRDFSTTYQWLRELKRWHGLPMVAVHLHVPDGELVWVGRYGESHRPMAASQAAGWIEANPRGAQMLLPRSVAVKEIDSIRSLPQLVGWREIPEEDRKGECVCFACLPPGLPDLLPRVRGVFHRAIHDLRRAVSGDEAAAALARMQIPLERAHGRLSPRRLLSQANSPFPEARLNLAMLLGHFAWREVEETLQLLLRDETESVRSQACYAVWCKLGCRRASHFLRDHPAVEFVFEYLEWEPLEARRLALEILTQSSRLEVGERARRLVAGL